MFLSILSVFALQAVSLSSCSASGSSTPTSQTCPLSFLVALALGGIAFAGLGLAAAALIQSQEAVAAVVNVIVLPMSFLSGAFGPPTSYRACSRWSPTCCHSAI